MHYLSSFLRERWKLISVNVKDIVITNTVIRQKYVTVQIHLENMAFFPDIVYPSISK
jgi:hypothetical protein